MLSVIIDNEFMAEVTQRPSLRLSDARAGEAIHSPRTASPGLGAEKSRVDRAERLSKALADTIRAGSLAVGFVDQLTNAALVAEAEASDRRAAEALSAARG